MGSLSEYLTAAEAAKKLGYNVDSVRHLLRSGKLQGQKLGRTWVVHHSAVTQFREAVRGKAKHDPTRGA